MKFLQFRLVHLLLLMVAAGVFLGVYLQAGKRTAVVKLRVYEITGDRERRYAQKIEIHAEFIGPEEVVEANRKGAAFGWKEEVVGIPKSLFNRDFVEGDVIRFRYRHFESWASEAENPQLILLRKLLRDSDPDEPIKADQAIRWVLK